MARGFVVGVAFLLVVLVTLVVRPGDGDGASPGTHRGGADVSSGDAANAVLAEARRVMSAYARQWQPEHVAGISLPQMPDTPDDVTRSVNVMRETSDKEILTSVAVIMVKYGRAVSAAYGHGTPIGRRDPIVDAFVAVTRADRLGDDIVTSSVAEWIANNREAFGSSPELDGQIEAWREEETARSRRYRLGSEPTA